MKNIPDKIYLQIGDADVTFDKDVNDFNELFSGAITWSADRINKNDIEYVLSTESEETEEKCTCNLPVVKKQYKCTKCNKIYSEGKKIKYVLPINQKQ